MLKLTTISTTFGLYWYNDLPFGVKQCPAYNKHGLQLNRDKSTFVKTEINILETIVSYKSAKPDPGKTSVIHGFRKPSNVAEIRSFIGLTEFYGRFIPRLSTLREPLTSLLKHDEPFQWTNDQQTAFNNLKNILSGDTVVTPFNPNDKVTLICDASPVDIGAILEQNGRLVPCVSKTLTTAEKGYPQIEQEALAIVWSIKRLHKYLFGRKFMVVTDNKPLFFLCNPGKAIPVMTAARLQRWLLILMAYNYDIEYRKGADIQGADTLSRYHSENADNGVFDVNNLQNTILPAPIDKSRIRKASKIDPDLRDVYKSIMHSWYGDTAPDYLKFRYEITVQDSLLYRGVRLVIPKCLQQEVLEHLHDGHVGTDAMKSIARQCVWWPTIDCDIDHWAKSCEGCCKGKSHPKSMWTPWPEEREKWSRVHVDLCGPFYDG